MNCKPGDLAVVVLVSGATGFARRVAEACIGRIVRVTHLREPHNKSNFGPGTLVWNFEAPLVVQVSGIDVTVTGTADSDLRPIRDNDGEDETLTWAGIPNEVTT